LLSNTPINFSLISRPHHPYVKDAITLYINTGQGCQDVINFSGSNNANQEVVTMRLLTGLKILGLCVLSTMSGSVFAATANADAGGDVSRQLSDIQKQLRDLSNDMKKLSGRVDNIEAMIPVRKKPQKVDVSLGGSPWLGDSKAKLGIVEFADYQCPYCRRFYIQTFPRLQKSYIDAGKLALIVKDFPLDFHPKAMGASLALHCVGKQDPTKFWDVQGELFTHQDRLGLDLYRELVKKYGLNQGQFDTCINDADQKKQVEDSLEYAQTLGVEGTPTFFIGRIVGGQIVNATPLVGAQPYPVFTRIIDSINDQQD
jgi:protein-disulfide isomerase